MVLNEKKKLTYEDKFARKFYCKHAALNSIRNDKKKCRKKMRQIDKKTIDNELKTWYNIYIRGDKNDRYNY